MRFLHNTFNKTWFGLQFSSSEKFSGTRKYWIIFVLFFYRYIRLKAIRAPGHVTCVFTILPSFTDEIFPSFYIKLVDNVDYGGGSTVPPYIKRINLSST